MVATAAPSLGYYTWDQDNHRRFDSDAILQTRSGTRVQEVALSSAYSEQSELLTLNISSFLFDHLSLNVAVALSC